jgi:ribosome-associated protein
VTRELQRTKKLTPQAAHSAPEGPAAAEPSLEDQDGPHLGGGLQDMILTRLDDDKAQDIVVIDLKNKSSVADCMIVASGRSHRHVGALADHVLRALKDAGYGKAKVEGLPHCDWVLIDAGDVIVHLFRPEVRTFYNLEKIWSVEPPSRAATH